MTKSGLYTHSAKLSNIYLLLVLHYMSKCQCILSSSFFPNPRKDIQRSDPISALSVWLFTAARYCSRSWITVSNRSSHNKEITEEQTGFIHKKGTREPIYITNNMWSARATIFQLTCVPWTTQSLLIGLVMLNFGTSWISRAHWGT